MKVKRIHLFVRMISVFVAFILGLVATIDCAHQIRTEQRKQVEQNLRDVAEQNEHQLQLVLDSHNVVLDAFCVQMSDEQDTSFLVDQLAPLVDIYGFKRIGFIDTNGMAYTTDKYTTDLSHREFFQRGMRGEHTVTDVLQDIVSMDMQDVNVFSAPVYRVNTDEIMGVMFFAFPTATFNRILHMSSFNEQGSSCIFQKDGEIVAATHTGNLDTGHNIFEELGKMDSSNDSEIDELMKFVSEDTADDYQVILSDGNEEYFFHFTKVDSQEGWYLTTLVPFSILSERTEPVLQNVQQLVVIMLLLLLFCLVIHLFTSNQQNKELFRLAYQDPLTGGDNYSAFREKMRGGVVSGAGYVVSVDLRSFGLINNTCGVAKGDELIRAMNEILANDVKHGELSAHVSGDRFVLFLHSPSDADLIERITTLRHTIVDLSPQLDIPHVMPQFGVRTVDSPATPEKSFSDANLAKEKVKDTANLFYSFFTEETRIKELEIQQLEDNFESALETRQFEMWYQPKVNPESSNVVSAEALVRWRLPDGSMIPPGKFIPLFERNGMIAELDTYTFEAVCRQQRVWIGEGKSLVPISVNVSRVSLYYEDIVARYMVILKRYDLPADCIELEITESALCGSKDISGVINQFRSCGFRILVDDFGSGYSSLSTLTKKYFDNIKLDKSLIDCIGAPEGNLLLKSTVYLAHEFKMTVTAEGVEEASQVAFLRTLSCDYIQGYYYSRPLPMNDFRAMLAGTDKA